MSQRAWWYSCLMVLVSLLSTTPCAEADEIVLEFPERGVGVVTVSTGPPEDLVNPELREDLVLKAIGRVTVPVGAFIGLEITKSASEDLSFLRRLPEGVISSLMLEDATVGNKQMRQVAETRSLQRLSFSNCQFSSDAFVGVWSLPELRTLLNTESFFRKSEQNRTALMNWAAASPRLQTFFCLPYPSAVELQAFQNHPSLESLYVEIGPNGEDVITQLRKLPRLKSLSISFENDAPVEASNELRRLARLEELTLYGGSVEGKILNEIAAKNPLKKLTLEHVEIGGDLGEALAPFQKLTALTLAPLQAERHPSLVKHLSQLPGLKDWPTLYLISKSDLDHILQSPWIESLSLKYIGDDMLIDDLQKIARLPRLRSLDLANIKVTDEWLSGLGILANLEHLSLSETEITGAGIRPVNFPMLERLHFWNEFFDMSVHELDLSSLSGVQSLRELSIGGRSFDTAQIETIRGCKSLRRIRIFGGAIADDSIISYIAEMPNLVELTLLQNSAITDEGAGILKDSRSIQYLSVGGFLSEDGCRALASIPTLRRLKVNSSETSSDCLDLIRDEYNLPHLEIRHYLSRMVRKGYGQVGWAADSIKGKDGFMRLMQVRFDRDFRLDLDKLEGSPAPMISVANDKQKNLLAEDLKGKVVLIDFGGTWCGPWRRSLPHLKDLYSKYHDQGFEILGVHTATGAENLDEFVTSKGIRWQNIVDTDGNFRDSYRVPSFPAFYLVDRKCILRVALAHPDEGLEEAIEKLLKESAE